MATVPMKRWHMRRHSPSTPLRTDWSTVKQRRGFRTSRFFDGMSTWPAFKAKRVLDALLRIGWRVKRFRGGSHRVLERDGYPDYIFSFHDNEEIGPRMLARIAKHTGLK